MKKRISLLIILLISIFSVATADAENSVDYKLTITKDFKFNEEIKYTLSDYKQVQNGYNYFAEIVSDDVYVDIMYKTKYKKTKSLQNGIYYVTLSHTYSEYTISNSLFLNNCFENENYKHDSDMYLFSGTGGFNCLRGDNLKITLITDFEVTETNAMKVQNKYIWMPTNEDFKMNIKIKKSYQENEDSNLGHGVNEDAPDIPEGVDVDPQEPESYDDIETEKEFNIIPYIVVGTVLIGMVAIIIIILKSKKKNLDQI